MSPTAMISTALRNSNSKHVAARNRSGTGRLQYWHESHDCLGGLPPGPASLHRNRVSNYYRTPLSLGPRLTQGRGLWPFQGVPLGVRTCNTVCSQRHTHTSTKYTPPVMTVTDTQVSQALRHRAAVEAFAGTGMDHWWRSCDVSVTVRMLHATPHLCVSHGARRALGSCIACRL